MAKARQPAAATVMYRTSAEAWVVRESAPRPPLARRGASHAAQTRHVVVIARGAAFTMNAESPAERADERRWSEAFARSAGALAALADEALAEHHAGRTKLLDPDQL